MGNIYVDQPKQAVESMTSPDAIPTELDFDQLQKDLALLRDRLNNIGGRVREINQRFNGDTPMIDDEPENMAGGVVAVMANQIRGISHVVSDIEKNLCGLERL